MQFFYEKRPDKVWVSHRLACAPHLHGQVELVYMRGGRSSVQVDAREYDLRAGQVSVVFPNQVHSYRSVGQEDYVICVFSADDFPEYYSVFHKKTPASPVVDCGRRGVMVSRCIGELERLERERPLHWQAMQRGWYLVLLGEIFSNMKLVEVDRSDSDSLRRILRYCTEHYVEELSLERLAAGVHLSKYTVSRIFSQRIGMSFCDYLGSLRISGACRLLETTSQSVTEIAYAVGVGSTRSFNRLFQKHMGTTPHRYRAERG